MNTQYIEELKNHTYDSLAKLKVNKAKEIKLHEKNELQNIVTYLPLWMHMLDAIAVADYLWDQWIPLPIKRRITTFMGNKDQAKSLVLFLSGSHDIGKMTNGFQSLIWKKAPACFLEKKPRWISVINENHVHHSTMSYKILREENYPKWISSIVGAHHGVFKNWEDSLINSYLVDYYPLGESEKENDEQIKSVTNDWSKIWCQILNLLKQISGLELDLDLNKLEPGIEDLLVLNGVVILTDWLASNTEFFPLIKNDSEELWSFKRVTEGLGKIDFPKYWEPNSYIRDVNDFKRLFSFYPNRLQQTAIEITKKIQTPGLFIIEAEMGIGKTEAALAIADIFAYKNGSGGLFFGLPTQATANSLFSRVTKWAGSVMGNNGKNSITVNLAHSRSYLNQNFLALKSNAQIVIDQDSEIDGISDYVSSELIVNEWLTGRKRQLLSDIVVGTVDQLLLMGKNNKHVALRHLAAAGKVVILDEIHSFDVYTNQIIDRSLYWLGAMKVPVILLSATLPSDRRNAMLEAYRLGNQKRKIILKTSKNYNQNGSSISPGPGYPLLSWTDGCENESYSLSLDCSESKHINLRFIDQENYIEEIVGVLKNKLHHGGAAGIIVNTVSLAQKLYGIIKEEFEEANVVLSHSRYTGEDRQNIESKILRLVGKDSSRPKDSKIIVIGTQTLEQSLDIDFDILFSQFAPIDLLLQRSGRLHRHIRTRTDALSVPYLYIFGLNFLDKKTIYDQYILYQTYNALMNRTIVNYPDDIPYLVESVYSDQEITSHDDPTVVNLRKKSILINNALKNKSEGSLLKKPTKRLKSLADLDATSYSGLDAETVRDIDEGISIILLKVKSESEIQLCNEQQTFRIDSVPEDPADRQLIFNQRLVLPKFILKKMNLRDDGNELNNLLVWKESSWFKKEFLLLLDEQNYIRLSDRSWRYDSEYGLQEEI